MSNTLTKILKLSAIFFVVGFFFFGSAHSASAATKYWTGTGTWNAANTNWGTAPGGPYNTTFDTGDDAVFEGTAGTVTVSSPNNPATITFNVTGYTLSGGTITNTSGGFTIYVANGVSATVSSLINPNATWAAGVVSGTGTLTLSGNSTFAGSFYLYSGVTVVVSNAGALGTSANPTYVQSGATLDINGYALSEPLELIGTGVSGAGALTNSGGSMNYAGLITLGGSATINSPNASGGISLTNVGTITGSGYDLTFDGAATNVQISSIIGTGTGKVYKTGTGTVTFYSNSTYTGGFYLLNGTAKIQNSGSDFGNGTIYMGDTSGSNSVIFTHSGQHVTNPINIVSGSSGTKTINMSVSGGTSTWSGGFVLNDNVTLNVATGSSGFSVTGGITGTGNFTVTGSGLNQTFSTNPVNMSGVFTNSSSATSTISGGVGSNVTGITNNGNGIITISTNALTVNSSGTTIINSNTTAAKITTISGGVSGTGDLIIKNNNTLNGAIAITTTSINNTGKIINSGTGSGTETITATIGTNVTEINQNSTTSSLTVSGAETVGATGKIFRNTAGTKILTISGGVTGTGNITIANDSDLTAGVTLSTAALNNIGTITNSGTGSGTSTISFAIGSNVTNVIQNSTTSALNLSTINTNQQLTIYAGTVNCTSTASCVGSGNITLGNTTGTDSASFLVGTTGLTIARPVILATNATAGTLTLGNSGAGVSVIFSGGVTGTNNLTINENGTSGTITFSTASINNAGTVTNIGAGSGTTTISGGIGANVTQVISNSTTSALTIGTTAITVNSSSTTLKNSAGTTVLTVTGGVSGTGNLILSNDSSTTAGIAITTTTVNNVGTVTNSGTGSGTATISAIIGTNVTGVTQNSTTSALNLSGVNTFNSGTGLSIKAGTVNCTSSASCVGAQNINLGDTTGSNAASLLVGSNLTIARPVILATNATAGTLTLGNSGAGVSIVFSGGVTGTNNLTINENGTVGTITFSTASINNAGTVTHIGAGSGTTTALIGSNVTGLIQNSATSTLSLSGTTTISGAITLTLGTLTFSNNDVTATSFSSSNANIRTITLGSGTLTLSGTGTVWDTSTTTNLTVTATTGTIKLTDSSSSSKTFAGGGKAFNNLWFAGGAGTGAYTISGDNTFADFKDDGTGAHNINFTASSTTTITTLTLDTTGSSLITLASTTPTSQWNLVDTAGTNTVQYVSITDSCASGGATWVSSDASNVNGGNNCGWTFPTVTVSGTANGNDGATVKIAINGSIDAHTATIASSAWSISNVSALSVNDIVTVWADGVTDANETTAITKYSSGTTVTGMVLNTNVLTIGSDQNTSVSVTNMGLYDADSDEDIMHTSNSGALLVQAASNTYTGETLSILAGNALTASSASTETINTEKINNAGTLSSTGSPTYTLTGTSGTLFTNSGVFTPATSEVIVTSASGTPTLLSSGTTFHKLTINSAATVINAGATITMSSADAANKLYVQTGVLNDGGNQIAGTANGTLVVSSGSSLCLSGTPASTTATCDSGATPTSATTFPTNYTNGNITLSNGGYYRAITIDHTKVPNTDQTDFPILISGTYSYLKTVANGGLVQNANGYDIGFYSDSALTTKLSWETERYIATTGEVVYWVKVPTLATASDTTIYMGYGNATITTDQSSPTGVWNSAYKGAWHLPDGSSLNINDSTSNAANGSLVDAPTATTGKIDGGILLDGTSDAVNFGQVAVSDTSATYSFWVKFSSINTNVRVPLGWGGTGAQLWVFNIGLRSTSGTAPSSGNARMYIRAYDIGVTGSTSTNNSVYGSTNISADTWYHVSVDGNASAYHIYLNGTAESLTTGLGSNNGRVVGTLAKSGTTRMAAGVNFYSNAYDFAGTGFAGSMDELRISNVVRSADWVATEYNNQSSPSTFYSVGSELNATSSTVFYNADAAMTVSATPTYANLKFQPVLTGARTYTLDSGLTLTGALTSTPSGAYALTANVGSSGLTVAGLTTLSGASLGTTTLDTTASNYALSSGAISIDSGSTLNARGSTVTLSGSGTVFSNSGTYTAGTSTIKLTDATSVDKTFAGAGGTYNNIWLTGAGTGSFIITGSNTFNQFLADTAPHTIKFAAGTTQSVNNWNVVGKAGSLMTLNSTVNGSKWYLSSSAGNSGIFSDYISLRDSGASGGATFYAGSSSVDDTTGGSTNTGWIFVLRSQGGGGGNVESSATPDAQVGGGGQGGGAGVDSGGTPDAGAGGGGQGGGGGDLGFLNKYRGSLLASVGSLNIFSFFKHLFLKM